MTLGTNQENRAVLRFETFYLDEYDPAVRRAYLMLGSREAAEDAVHDSFVEVFHRWDSISDPGPYLSRVVLNRCRDQHRRSERLGHLLRRLHANRPGQPPRDLLDDVLSALPFNQRAAVVLKHYGGFSHSEIAAALGCRPGSVGPWLARAHRTLRKAMTDEPR